MPALPRPTRLPPSVANIEDLRRLAERRVPRAFFGYLEAGAHEELTLQANRRALDAVQLRPRVLAGVAQRDLRGSLLGQPCAMPLALAPAGLTGVIWPQGEILAALAARDAGLPFTLSTVSIASMEAVRAATGTPFWFQLYVMRDRAVTQDLIARAAACGCPVLFVTVDLAVQAQRHRDVRNGMQLRSRLGTLGNVLNMAARPAWLHAMLRAGKPRFGNLAPYIPGSRALRTDGPWVADQLDPGMNWDDLAWIRAQWPGRLVVKGIVDADDARRAVALGADAIVVSNHGGRQLDGGPPAIAALPAVLDAVGASRGRATGNAAGTAHAERPGGVPRTAEVWLDSGLRSGHDLLKALACGAHGALIGRAWLYGLGAGGQAGVALALELLRREFDTALALTGTARAADIGPHLLWAPASAAACGPAAATPNPPLNAIR